ncbi:MAG: hypothetical protein HRU20_29375 [Pseudomonadales bacterium]|nr:hypothetical protein [Pseudomonadales bacterium]
MPLELLKGLTITSLLGTTWGYADVSGYTDSEWVDVGVYESSSLATVMETYTCSIAGDIRLIQVLRYLQGDVLCEVSYEKKGGEATLLWNARWDREYCSHRASEFAAKQAGWGWRCVDGGGESVEALQAARSIDEALYRDIEPHMSEAATVTASSVLNMSGE